MSKNWLTAIFGTNFFLFLQSFEGFLRAGTAALAFVTAGLSVTILAYKERHTIKQMMGRGEDEKPPTNL